MVWVCYQGLSGPYKQYLEPHQGQTSVHPTTLQAHNCISDGTLSSWNQHGHTVITFGLESSNRHNSAQL